MTSAKTEWQRIGRVASSSPAAQQGKIVSPHAVLQRSPERSSRSPEMNPRSPLTGNHFYPRSPPAEFRHYSPAMQECPSPDVDIVRPGEDAESPEPFVTRPGIIVDVARALRAPGRSQFDDRPPPRTRTPSPAAGAFAPPFAGLFADSPVGAGPVAGRPQETPTGRSRTGVAPSPLPVQVPARLVRPLEDPSRSPPEDQISENVIVRNRPAPPPGSSEEDLLAGGRGSRGDGGSPPGAHGGVVGAAPGAINLPSSGASASRPTSSELGITGAASFPPVDENQPLSISVRPVPGYELVELDLESGEPPILAAVSTLASVGDFARERSVDLRSVDLIDAESGAPLSPDDQLFRRRVVEMEMIHEINGEMIHHADHGHGSVTVSPHQQGSVSLPASSKSSSTAISSPEDPIASSISSCASTRVEHNFDLIFRGDLPALLQDGDYCQCFPRRLKVRAKTGANLLLAGSRFSQVQLRIEQPSHESLVVFGVDHTSDPYRGDFLSIVDDIDLRQYEMHTHDEQDDTSSVRPPGHTTGENGASSSSTESSPSGTNPPPSSAWWHKIFRVSLKYANIGVNIIGPTGASLNCDHVSFYPRSTTLLELLAKNRILTPNLIYLGLIESPNKAKNSLVVRSTVSARTMRMLDPVDEAVSRTTLAELVEPSSRNFVSLKLYAKPRSSGVRRVLLHLRNEVKWKRVVEEGHLQETRVQPDGATESDSELYFMRPAGPWNNTAGPWNNLFPESGRSYHEYNDAAGRRPRPSEIQTAFRKASSRGGTTALVRDHVVENAIAQQVSRAAEDALVRDHAGIYRSPRWGSRRGDEESRSSSRAAGNHRMMRTSLRSPSGMQFRGNDPPRPGAPTGMRSWEDLRDVFGFGAKCATATVDLDMMLVGVLRDVFGLEDRHIMDQNLYLTDEMQPGEKVSLFTDDMQEQSSGEKVGPVSRGERPSSGGSSFFRRSGSTFGFVIFRYIIALRFLWSTPTSPSTHNFLQKISHKSCRECSSGRLRRGRHLEYFASVPADQVLLENRIDTMVVFVPGPAPAGTAGPRGPPEDEEPHIARQLTLTLRNSPASTSVERMSGTNELRLHYSGAGEDNESAFLDMADAASASGGQNHRSGPLPSSGSRHSYAIMEAPSQQQMVFPNPSLLLRQIGQELSRECASLVGCRQRRAKIGSSTSTTTTTTQESQPGRAGVTQHDGVRRQLTWPSSPGPAQQQQQQQHVLSPVEHSYVHYSSREWTESNAGVPGTAVSNGQPMTSASPEQFLIVPSPMTIYPGEGPMSPEPDPEATPASTAQNLLVNTSQEEANHISADARASGLGGDHVLAAAMTPVGTAAAVLADSWRLTAHGCDVSDSRPKELEWDSASAAGDVRGRVPAEHRQIQVGAVVYGPEERRESDVQLPWPKVSAATVLQVQDRAYAQYLHSPRYDFSRQGEIGRPRVEEAAAPMLPADDGPDPPTPSIPPPPRRRSPAAPPGGQNVAILRPARPHESPTPAPLTGLVWELSPRQCAASEPSSNRQRSAAASPEPRVVVPQSPVEPRTRCSNSRHFLAFRPFHRRHWTVLAEGAFGKVYAASAMDVTYAASSIMSSIRA